MIDLGEDSVLCYGNVLFKDVFFPGSEYLWQDGSVYHDYAIREPGLYTVEAYNSCFSTYDSLLVEFDDCGTCVHVPTAFTPNNDGLNDLLFLQSDAPSMIMTSRCLTVGATCYLPPMILKQAGTDKMQINPQKWALMSGHYHMAEVHMV